MKDAIIDVPLLSKPTRQHIAGLLLILYTTTTNFAKAFWPILVPLLFRDKGIGLFYWLLGIGIVMLLIILFSVINYLNHKHYILNNEVVVEKGVFIKKKVAIPFEKIQNIDVEQALYHQIMEVAKLKIDTAGSDKEEAHIHAISLERANQIRNAVLGSVVERSAAIEDNEIVSEDDPKPDLREKIAHLSIGQLLKVGFSENHFRSGFVILAGIYFIFDKLKDLKLDEDYNVDTAMDYFVNSLLFAGVFLTVFVILSVLTSLVRSVLKHYDMQLWRTDNGYTLTEGLFNKKNITLKDHMIQSIAYSENPLQRLLSVKSLTINQTKSSNRDTKHQILIAGVNNTQVSQILNKVFDHSNHNTSEYIGISPLYARRYQVIWSIVMAIAFALLYYFDNKILAVFSLVFWVYILYAYSLYAKKKQFAFDENYFYLKGYAIVNKQQVIPIRKIQSVKIKTSPFQKRNNLCSLEINEGSVKVFIPYVDKDSAYFTYDVLTYWITK